MSQAMQRLLPASDATLRLVHTFASLETLSETEPFGHNVAPGVPDRLLQHWYGPSILSCTVAQPITDEWAETQPKTLHSTLAEDMEMLQSEPDWLTAIGRDEFFRMTLLVILGLRTLTQTTEGHGGLVVSPPVAVQMNAWLGGETVETTPVGTALTLPSPGGMAAHVFVHKGRPAPLFGTDVAAYRLANVPENHHAYAMSRINELVKEHGAILRLREGEGTIDVYIAGYPAPTFAHFRVLSPSPPVVETQSVGHRHRSRLRVTLE